MMDTSSELSELSSSPLPPSSSPISVLSRTPSLSPSPSPRSRSSSPLAAMSRYPSPLSTIPSGSTSPRKAAEPIDADSIFVDPSGAPPRKRRRIERKPRTTEHLVLRTPDEFDAKDEESLSHLTSALRKKKKIVVVAGAGISVSAGIPDFRSSKGLFNTLKAQHKLKASGKQLFDASVYRHDDSTSSFHEMVRELADQAKHAQPTAFHHMVASIAKEGRLLRLYSQNVDGIDTAMEPLHTNVPLNTKGPWPRTIQLHGGLEKMVCTKCQEVSDFQGSLFEGSEAPLCKSCEETDNVRTSHAGKRSHGIGRLRPRIVLYNEYNPDQEAIDDVVKSDMRAKPDAVLVVGTSMKIPGVRKLVRDLCGVTRARRDGIAIWINLDPEPSGVELKNCWDIVVRGKCDDVATLVGLPHWDESPIIDDDVRLVDKKLDKYEENIRSTKLEVRIHASPELPASTPAIEATVKQESRASTPIEAKPRSIERTQGIPTPIASPKLRTALPVAKSQLKKQSKLAFSTGPMADAPSIKPVKKSAQRKPRRSKKSDPKPHAPKATVMTSFKATKTGAAVLGKVHKKLPEPASPTRLLNTTTQAIYSSDFGLRSAIRKPDGAMANAKLDQRAVDSQLRNEMTMYHDAPTTPTRSHQTESDRSETITPPSKPNGFGALID